MEKLSFEEWKTIITNVNECDEDDEFGTEIEVLWLDDTDEWVLCHGYELFEEGFKTEKEARERLKEIYNNVL